MAVDYTWTNERNSEPDMVTDARVLTCRRSGWWTRLDTSREAAIAQGAAPVRQTSSGLEKSGQDWNCDDGMSPCDKECTLECAGESAPVAADA